MKRIIYMVIRNLFIMPYFLIKLCYYASHVDKIPETDRYQLLRKDDAGKGRSCNMAA